MKNDDIFKFTDNDGSEDIYSSSSKRQEGQKFEDVYSSSKTKKNTGEHYYRSERNRKKKKNKKLKIALISVLSVLAVVLVALVVAITTILGQFDYNYNELDATNSELGFNQSINKQIINVALFGVDTRDTQSLTGNTDSIMVLSANTKTKEIKLISIMRDSLVEINHEGNQTFKKINSAYGKGGPELAIRTINQNFGLDISEYATVNWFGMADIIDVVGGIEVELTAGEVAPVTSGDFALNESIRLICEKAGKDPTPYYILKPGKHHLNGIQASAYSRLRYVSNIWGGNNDQGRTERQRYVLSQLFEKAKGLKKTKYLDLIKAMMPYVETSLSTDEIFGLAVKIMLNSPTMEQSRIPLDEYQMPAPRTLSGVGSYVYFDRDYAAEVVHAFIYDDIDPTIYMQQHEIRKNDWYADVAR